MEKVTEGINQKRHFEKKKTHQYEAFCHVSFH